MNENAFEDVGDHLGQLRFVFVELLLLANQELELLVASHNTSLRGVW